MKLFIEGRTDVLFILALIGIIVEESILLILRRVVHRAGPDVIFSFGL